MIAFWNNENYDWKIEFLFDDNINVMRSAGLRLTALPDTRTLRVNLGRRCDVNALVIKRGIATAVNEARRLGSTSILVVAFEVAQMLGGRGLFPMIVGAKLALYEPPCFKHEKDSDIRDGAGALSIYIGSEQFPGEFTDLKEANILSDNILFARKMVDTPANMLTPRIMAECVAEYCDKHGVHCEIFDESFIMRQKMGAFWAVGGSSGNMPRLIVLRHMGNPDNYGDITAIIGKAVTFDTGGYSLKPSANMKNMKCDMAGGAAAVAVVTALAQNKVKANVVAVIPAAENRISNGSFVPGDVLKTMSGRTIEVISTDAEGRLCMSDAMTYAIHSEKASRLIDIATLTGAAVQVFGRKTAATMTNNGAFYDDFLRAAKDSGEQYWLMPSYDEYYLMIESQAADLRNAPEEGCGIMAAGLFMEHFAEGLPWIHVDIAGTAFCDKPGYEFQRQGRATGAGIETLYTLFAGRVL